MRIASLKIVACALLYRMELSLKSKCIKKKHKKKKLRILDSALEPLIKPDAFDGLSNWMKMQKVLGPVKEIKTKKQPEGKTNKIIGIKQTAKDYKPPFSHKENIHSRDRNYESSQANNTGKIVPNRTYAKAVSFNLNSNKNAPTVSNENTKSVSNKDQSEQFSYFNESDKNAQEISSTHEPESTEKKLTKAIAMDCEMVGTGPTGDDSMIARVSIVNSYGDCLYDEFVKPKERVTDFRTKISGVRPSDLKKGKELLEVQKDVLQIIEGRILVGHSIKHDLDVLFISHPRQLIRDTAYYQPFRDLCGGRTPSLKKLTAIVLGVEIQSGEHSSVEDAQATMLLYLRQRREWESFVRSQRKRKPKINNQSAS